MKKEKELSELFQKKSRMVEEIYQDKEEIEKFILKELKSLYDETIEDTEEDFLSGWEVEVMENEFSLYNTFGHIDFEDVIKLRDIYKKHGFRLYYISDGLKFSNHAKGILFGFCKTEEANEEEK